MVDLERRVFVGNLAYRTTCEDLKEHFSQAGKVKKAEVYYDHSGKGPPTVVGRPVSKGCGVVEFEDEADAKYAVKELTETMLDGRAILVREDREQPPPTRKHDAIAEGTSRPGDWICPKCSDMQFASRRECRSCGEPRPTTMSKPKGASFGANDWTCPSCGDHQFARNGNADSVESPNQQREDEMTVPEAKAGVGAEEDLHQEAAEAIDEEIEVARKPSAKNKGRKDGAARRGEIGKREVTRKTKMVRMQKRAGKLPKSERRRSTERRAVRQKVILITRAMME
eukprot:CAMPEP_0169119098 /NCGR_PEP_ID=MMETSP1015-20121227/31362_1 /TAXON_ID=342587 /ORGANISM="Karlodinium micrum, Strain CCMP2283" /LENGTH=282 /DNA_ID=CAMNT_0009181929 /DNA_START=146 /DNA_END=992 /DNA_ORIENTATION=-